MSLINEALKKAQRQRTDDTADPMAAVGAGDSARRNPGSGKKTVFLIGGGAVALVVLSVILTISLVSRPPAEPAPAAPPEIKLPAPAPVAEVPVMTPVPTPSPNPPAPVAEIAPPPAPAVAAAPVVTARPDAQVQAFVDGVKITGVKAAGDESRVLMNDKVYRVNEMVERTLGVRLLKVEADNLTFSDANGVTYLKYF